MAALYADDFHDRTQSLQNRLEAELANRIPNNSSVSIVYMKQISNIIVIEIPLSPLMARFKKAGLLGCFDNTGVNSENYKEFLDE